MSGAAATLWNAVLASGATLDTPVRMVDLIKRVPLDCGYKAAELIKAGTELARAKRVSLSVCGVWVWACN